MTSQRKVEECRIADIPNVDTNHPKKRFLLASEVSRSSDSGESSSENSDDKSSSKGSVNRVTTHKQQHSSGSECGSGSGSDLQSDLQSERPDRSLPRKASPTSDKVRSEAQWTNISEASTKSSNSESDREDQDLKKFDHTSSTCSKRKLNESSDDGQYSGLDVAHQDLRTTDQRKKIAGPIAEKDSFFSGGTLKNMEEFKRICVKKPGLTSRYRGVSYKVKDKRFVAQIRAEGKQHYLGLYETEEEAAAAYDAAAIKFKCSLTRLNFPPDGKMPPAIVQLVEQKKKWSKMQQAITKDAFQGMTFSAVPNLHQVNQSNQGSATYFLMPFQSMVQQVPPQITQQLQLPFAQQSFRQQGSNGAMNFEVLDTSRGGVQRVMGMNPHQNVFYAMNPSAIQSNGTLNNGLKGIVQQNPGNQSQQLYQQPQIHQQQPSQMPYNNANAGYQVVPQQIYFVKQPDNNWGR